MKTLILVSTLLFFSFSSMFAQIEDDLYYSPKKIKPLKNRKEYTKSEDRVFLLGNSLHFYSSTINKYWDKNSNEQEVFLYIFQGL